MRLLFTITTQHLISNQYLGKLNINDQIRPHWGNKVVSDENREKLQAFVQAVKNNEDTFGLNHLNVAISLNDLATFYLYQKMFLEALPLYQRAVKILEVNVEKNDPRLTSCELFLAMTYQSLSGYNDAIFFYKRVQETLETTNEANVPLSGLFFRLGRCYYEQGIYNEAETAFLQTLRLDESKLGPNHPNLVSDLNNLAMTYRAQGRYDEALPLYQRALKISECNQESHSIDLANSLSCLAELYTAQRKFREALPFYQRALRIDEATRKPNDPSLATNLNNVAGCYGALGWYDEALILYQRAIEIRKIALGQNHPYLAHSLNDLGLLFGAQGKYTEAIPLYQRALKIYQTALGLNHPYSTTCLNNLAQSYLAIGRYNEANALLQSTSKDPPSNKA